MHQNCDEISFKTFQCGRDRNQKQANKQDIEALV